MSSPLTAETGEPQHLLRHAERSGLGNFVEPVQDIASTISGLQADWTFEASDPGLRVRLRRHWVRLRRQRAAPAFQVIKAVSRRPLWVVYFVFAPAGRIGNAHRVALARLKDMGIGLFVVCATERPDLIPAEVLHAADAVCWKALSGYDFSAYSLALHLLARQSPDADVFVMNDSVYGPFEDLRPWMRRARWDLTGFTALDATENHIQSYAFFLRGVSPERMRALDDVLPSDRSFDRLLDVVLMQEIQFARVAAQSMSVGAYWYAQESSVGDPVLVRPFELIDAGFPFLKKSLLGKMAQFQPTDRVVELLVKRGFFGAAWQR